MPQIQLPVFPAGSAEINCNLAFACRDNEVTYFNACPRGITRWSRSLWRWAVWNALGVQVMNVREAVPGGEIGRMVHIVSFCSKKDKPGIDRKH
jgi:hypothetical protein